MDQVDTLHIGKYWSKSLCRTIMTNLGVYRSIFLEHYDEEVDTLHVGRYWSEVLCLEILC